VATSKSGGKVMKISEARPLSLSGIPFLMVVLAVCLILILPRYSEYWQVSILGGPSSSLLGELPWKFRMMRLSYGMRLENCQ